AVIARQRVAEPRVLAGHVAAEAGAAVAARRVVRVRRERLRLAIGAVALEADAVALHRPQLVELLAPILGVRLVARGAAHLAGAAAEQVVPCLARVDRAPARGCPMFGLLGVARPSAALPRVGVPREQNGVAPGAGVVDPLGAARGALPHRARR